MCEYFLREETSKLVGGFLSQKNFPINFFIDTMTNQACNAFGALPERLAVILDGKIEFLGGTGPTGYSIPELENHLMKY